MLACPFTMDETPELAQVGGKAMSLILMTRHGLPVPPGFVLSVAFFQPWLADIQNTLEWVQALNSSPKELRQNCDALKALCANLELDEVHKKVLANALAALKGNGQMMPLAVRSSSPEEDLEGASFAGGYETVLGVKEDGLEDAVRRAFTSCLDERIFVYKRERGFAVDQPRIAVIVQQQIAAEAAGVAFSLNPLNNCYDEAVVNANFGLGETVVSGAVTPDTFIVDKVSRAILERKTGNKETSVWLGADGGTYEEPSSSHARLCLSDAEVLELTDMLVNVEDHYQKPIDIEWAFAGGKLYLLQARPITAYVPLPEEMLTEPGEPRTLYIDYTLAKQGINYPLSVMGADCWERVQRAVMGADGLFGCGDGNGLMFTLGGRFYANLSATLRLQGKERTASQIRIQDMLSAEIIRDLDDSYIAQQVPGSLIGALLRMALSRVGTMLPALGAFLWPERQHRVLVEETQRLDRDLAEEAAKGHSPETLAQNAMGRFARYMNKVSLPVTVAAELARSKIRKLFAKERPEIRARIIHLERALPHNVTVEMGLAMYRLATFEEIKACHSAAEFTRRIRQRAFSTEFLRAWDRFMQAHGHRGSEDLDIASPRFYEVPADVYRQLRTMALNTDEETDPLATYERGAVERKETYDLLRQIVCSRGKRKASKFEKYYNVLVTFSGYREIHKYYIVRVVDMLRKKVLSAAHSLVEAGRLDYPEQVFDLTIKDLDRGVADPFLDLRALAEENTRFLKKIRHVRNFPRIIDSRGKILRPPRKGAKEGEMVGEPISPGVVRGKVKILSRPDEKTVLPGEILVARATDPGWTPLFLNAGGIVLEVGGVLQHGALVAREYCKPCVAGIENATTIFKDGQVVEMDGSNGVIRLM
jgi:phosphohistidine swiveling domain-containing protein